MKKGKLMMTVLGMMVCVMMSFFSAGNLKVSALDATYDVEEITEVNGSESLVKEVVIPMREGQPPAQNAGDGAGNGAGNGAGAGAGANGNYADGNSGDAISDGNYTTVVNMFITWFRRIGALVAFVGAVMFGLAIKNNDADQKQNGLLTMVAGFVVVAICVGSSMFGLFN